MWAISGSDLGQISPIIWTPPSLIFPAGQYFLIYSNHLRTNLFNTLDSLNNITWQQSISVMDKFKFIVQPNSKETALLICKYLKACFEMRKDHM